MCAVSAITDYYREKWPLPHYEPYGPIVRPNQTQPFMPEGSLDPKQMIISWEQWQEYQELKRRMEAYDKATGQPDCIKPEVAEWEEEIRKIVKQEMGVIKNG